jgi:PKD repeat protein
VLALLPVQVRAVPPTASFAVSTTTPRIGAPVTFTPQITPAGTATIASVVWAFGDGATVTANAAQQHAYAAAGTFTVTMTVTDSNNEKTTAQQTITVAANPTADFTFSPAIPNAAGQPNSAVTFDGTASKDPQNLALTYQWDFGDGTPPAAGAQPAHTYAGAGDKKVTLKVTAADGASATVAKTLHVNQGPHGALTYAVAAGDQLPGQDPLTPIVGQRVLFDGFTSSDPDGSIASYAWDLAGNNTYNSPGGLSSVLQTFPTAGQKTVHLRVTDNDGAQDVAGASFRVNRLPVAGMSVSTTSPRAGDTVTLTSTSTDPDPAPDGIASTRWELSGNDPPRFDDGTGTTARVVFDTPGRHDVSVKVTDTGGAYAIYTKSLTVQPLRQQQAAGAATPTAPFDTNVAPPSMAPVTTSAARTLPGVRVRIAGSVTGTTTRVTLLSIVAPKGAIVTVACRGKGCPKRATRSRVPTDRRVRIRTMERALRSGAKLVVTIAKPGYLTRQVRFTIRRGMPPVRQDACVIGAGNKTGPCPA